MTLPNGYEMTTTFMMDFSIADKFGITAIKDTYKRAFEEWKDSYVYLTELVIVLNLKIWEWYEKNEDVALFKKHAIDYIQASEQRLKDAWISMDKKMRSKIKVINLISRFNNEAAPNCCPEK